MGLKDRCVGRSASAYQGSCNVSGRLRLGDRGSIVVIVFVSIGVAHVFQFRRVFGHTLFELNDGLCDQFMTVAEAGDFLLRTGNRTAGAIRKPDLT